MRSYNKGTIFTNNNCIACNKCISECSIPGANISGKIDGVTQIFINSSKCTDCGLCINSCPHNAREYHDDTDNFFEALSKGEKITVIISSTFEVLYKKEFSNIIGYLRSLGVNNIYSSGYGDTISIWANTKFIKEYSQDARAKPFIANTCPSVIHRIEKFYPYLVDKLIPVQSSEVCEAIYLHKYLNNTDKIALIGPCVSKYREIHNKNTNDNINYLITYKHLMSKIRNVDISSFNSQMDTLPIKPTIRNLLNGSFKTEVARNFPNGTNFLYFEGERKENYDILTVYENPEDTSIRPQLIEFVSCIHGCYKGPGTEKHKLSFDNILIDYSNIQKNINHETDWKTNWEKLQKETKDLVFDDFLRKFDNCYIQTAEVPKTTYDDIFNYMRKDTPEKRSINCGSCGYKSCYDMATAIAYGYNQRENCIHYMNEQLFYNYYIDSVTGINNTNAYIKKVTQLFENNPDKFYLICNGDINKFKVINDLFGMPLGDEVLKYIAKKLSEIAGNDGFCCRLGGGTFSITVENTPENLQRIRNLKYFDCSHLGINIPVTMRFGIYIPENNNFDLTAKLSLATIAMDKAYSTSQNTFTLFTEDFRKQAKQEIEITSKLQPALENNEFVLWFQPQYKASTGELIGAEALCRWISDGKIISPGIFIPVAEKNGFIKILDVEIWKQAFKTIRNWIDKGITPVPISINISRISLSNDSLIYTIKHFLEEYKIPTKYVHFEVTESAYMEDQKNLIDRINKIRELGFQIAMDDFGSGYSSLNTLKDLPIDILKLDMGFIKDKTNMDKGGKILTFLTHMAQNLEFTTIAEGVEYQEQADFLKSIGIDIIQGYLYAKPMPENNFVELLINNEKNVQIDKSKRIGIVDISNFYNPDSSESIMFNNLSGPAAIVEYSPKIHNLEILRINQKSLRIFGIESIPFKDIQKLFKSFFSKETKKKFIEAINKTINTGSEVVFEIKNKELLHESFVWVKVHLWQISQKNDLYTIYVLLEDITDEKLAQTNLEKTNTHLSSMIENSKVGMCLMNINVDFFRFRETIKIRIIEVNKEFVDISGYTEEEILSWSQKEAFSVIHPADRTGFLFFCFKAFLKKYSTSFSYDYRAKRKDGVYKHTRIILNGIKQDDGSYMIYTNYICMD